MVPVALSWLERERRMISVNWSDSEHHIRARALPGKNRPQKGAVPTNSRVPKAKHLAHETCLSFSVGVNAAYKALEPHRRIGHRRCRTKTAHCNAILYLLRGYTLH